MSVGLKEHIVCLILNYRIIHNIIQQKKVVMYIDNQFSVKSIQINEDINGWERQYIEISHKTMNAKKYKYM